MICQIICQIICRICKSAGRVYYSHIGYILHIYEPPTSLIESADFPGAACDKSHNSGDGCRWSSANPVTFMTLLYAIMTVS